MYKMMLSVCCLCFVLTMQGQVIVYQSSQLGFLTQTQLDSIKTAMEKKTAPLHMQVTLSTEDLRRSNDTLFRKFNFQLVSKDLIDQMKDKNLLIGQKLPAFALRDLGNRAVTESIAQGKVLLINCWFTTCAPCIAEMPELNRIKALYQGKDVVFIAMAIEDAGKIQAFLKKHAFDFMHLQKAQAYIEKHYGTGYPKNILVGKDGKIKLIEDSLAAIDGNAPAGKETKYIINSKSLIASIDRELEVK